MPARDGTLARVALTGGAPREILDDVIAADWRPGSDELAVIRRDRVEFPLGNTIHGEHRFKSGADRARRPETRARRRVRYRRARSLRAEDDVVLRMGRHDQPSRGLRPAMRCGSRPIAVATIRFPWTLRAVSLSGKERVLSSSVGTGLSILDVFHDGRALIATTSQGWGASVSRPGKFNRESSHGSTAPRQRRSRVMAARCCSAKCSEVPGERFDLPAQNGRLGRHPTGRWIRRRSLAGWKVGSRNPGRYPSALDPHADRAWIGDNAAAGPAGGPWGGQLSPQRTTDRVRGKGEGPRSRRSMFRTSTADRFAPSLRRMSARKDWRLLTAAMWSAEPRSRCSSSPSTAARRSR